jgi:hypothetical protein
MNSLVCQLPIPRHPVPKPTPKVGHIETEEER